MSIAGVCYSRNSSKGLQKDNCCSQNITLHNTDTITHNHSVFLQKNILYIKSNYHVTGK